MFITQLLNRASSMMWAAIQKQNKTKQNNKKQKNKYKKKYKKQKQNKNNKKNNNNNKNKQTKNIMPAAMRYQHQMYMRFRHCTMDEMKKDKLAKD